MLVGSAVLGSNAKAESLLMDKPRDLHRLTAQQVCVCMYVCCGQVVCLDVPWVIAAGGLPGLL